ncbi:hypothetical protein BDR03DRAFT_969190 [Suillus americanus]|nr:hypothetical protein BDR03DRAFT_969190 [Suillus americanus]
MALMMMIVHAAVEVIFSRTQADREYHSLLYRSIVSSWMGIIGVGAEYALYR